MTLTTSLQKRFVIAIAMIALIGNGILSAKTPKKFTIEGRVLDGWSQKSRGRTLLMENQAKTRFDE